jgi:serine/threonine protein kinase
MLLELSQLGDACAMLSTIPSSMRARTFSNTSGRSGTMLPRQAQRIIQQIAVGLAAVHAARAVHGDLKPANVLLFGDAGALDIKLTDFTSSILLQDTDPPADGFGATLGWAGPEVWDTNPSVNSAVDIWSLGIMLLWLRTGPAVLNLTPSQLTAEPACAQISHLQPTEQHFVRCCLCMQPSARWSAERLLKEYSYCSQQYQGN